ncbi:MAG: hypothetical protein II336_20620 [Loktanella sp.]|nr:hypothetical protein [Loktanella sp.]
MNVHDYTIFGFQAGVAYIISLFVCIYLFVFNVGGSGGRLLLSFPLLTSIYFLFSMVIFDFGVDVPIYDVTRFAFDGYLWTITHFCLVFLAMFSGYAISRKFSYGAHGGGGAGNLIRLSSIAESVDRVGHRKSVQWFFVFIGVLPPILIFFSAPPIELWDRRAYPPSFTNERLVTFADTFFWVSAFCIPMINRTVFRYLIFTLLVLSFVAIGARQAFVAFVIYLMVRAGLMRKMGGLKSIFFMILSIWLLASIMQARVEWTGGILNVMNLFLIPRSETILALTYSINYMIMFSVVVNTHGTFYFAVEPSTFLYGVSPLPSVFGDQTSLFLLYNQLQSRVPLPGFAFSVQFLRIWGVSLIFFLLPIMLNTIRAVVWRRVNVIERIVFFFVLLIPLLFSLQYNIRGSSRLLYFFLIFYFILGLLSRARLKFRR